MAEEKTDQQIIIEKLYRVQLKLKVPKDMNNDFAGFKYRNAEAILEKVKPLLEAEQATILLNDEIVFNADSTYIKSTATFTDGKGLISVDAFAREEKTRPKMSEGQLTGSASSYARKYALNGLLLLDDNKDPDSHDNTPKAAPKAAPQNDTRPQRKQLDRLKQITVELDLDETNTSDFFQDAIGKPRPTTKEDFAKSIEFGQTILDDMAEKAKEVAEATREDDQAVES